MAQTPALSTRALYGAVLVMAATGLAYELALGTVDAFLTGDPIVNFALLIGLYMAALGAGAYASGWIAEHLAERFADTVIAVAAVGGTSAPVLHVIFSANGPFKAVLYGITLLLGTLVGLQLPLLMRILKRREGFADVVARALAFDYVGALVGSIGFSLILMPMLGSVRTTLVLGLFNVGLGIWVVYAWRRRMGGATARLVACVVIAGALAGLLMMAEAIEMRVENGM